MNRQENALELYHLGFTNQCIAKRLGVSNSTVTKLLKEKGIVRQVTNRFTSVESDFVIENYKMLGDTDLAEKLTEMGYPRNKKQIEKFRYHKNLHRTKCEIQAIRKNWEARGLYKDLHYTRTPEAIAKRSQSFKNTWKREKWRMVNGLSPITKLANRKVGKRIFSVEQVLEIRALKKGMLSDYAAKHNVSISAVSLAYRCKTYREISNKEQVVRIPEKPNGRFL
jgi:predicted transcriptional regulator